ncbi:MAG: type II toxin-antitoxin system VapC family toxin [Candidatus Eremiobacteraeota bacterium]|nr:type II toxin-antitoxin system VapC family toxin [Candidatus Eremiobacteraeota bacterium]MBV9055446.1 type II toxin-antitoxin system VapC family toxin [Candidatus Eremiobacteraeota bacterium]MBV9699795.1 type II toxin-antitoxin system VapC family toxin [Candidatus Eremiobacteraeota bacterium]
MNPILLDTHAAVWLIDGRLGSDAANEIEAASERDELLVSPVSAWEIALLVNKRRLTLAMGVEEYVRALFSLPGVVVAALTPSIAVAAANLPHKPPSDPIDRMLIASASAYGARLVTRDRAIRNYAKTTPTLRCIVC